MQTIPSGSTQSGLTVSSGSELDVLAGGIAVGASIAGLELLLGGTDSAGTVLAGGSQQVSSGGKAVGTAINAGAIQTVSSGGTARAGFVAGTAVVLAGGITRNMTVENGTGGFGAAVEIVGGQAMGTVVSSGGGLVVVAGGLATSSTIAAYGAETVSSGGMTSAGLVAARASLSVFSGGVAAGVTVAGSELLSGGTDSAGLISGTQTIGPGGLALNDTVAAGGLETVFAGGRTSGATVRGSVVVNGGVAVGLKVSSGGSLAIAVGMASGTVVSHGGSIVVSGGHTSGTVLVADSGTGGAVERVLSGATATKTTVAAFDQQVVAGGLTTGTVVQSGGVQRITGGGALNDLVSSGGMVFDNGVLGFTEDVSATIGFGGTLNGSGAVRQYGPGTLLLSGTLSGFTGTITIDGGTLELTSGAAAGAAPITFGSGSLGTLQVDHGVPGNVISGFAPGDSIDLAALADPGGSLSVSVSGNVATLTSGGVPVMLGGSVASLNIVGASGLPLVAESDGASGTLVGTLATVTSPNGGVAVQINGLTDGSWTYAEAAGTSAVFTDGGLYNFPNNSSSLPPAPSPLPAGSILQEGPGTLVLPSYESYTHFSGAVLIAGGTVDTSVPGGDGATSFSFVSGTTGTLVLEQLQETTSYNGLGYAYSPASFTPITQIDVGDVVDLTFLPFSSGVLATAVVSGGSGQLDITSGGQLVVFPSTTPINISAGVSAVLPIGNAGAYTYGLTADGTGGTDLTVTGYTAGPPPATSGAPPVSGTAGPPFGTGTVSNGGVAYTITTYGDGTVGVGETSGTRLNFTSAVSSGAELVQSGPGTLALGGGTFGGSGITINGGTVELTTPNIAGSAPIAFASGAQGTLLVDPASSTYNTPPANVINGFAMGDQLILSPTITSAGSIGVSVLGDVVTFTEDGSPLMAAGPSQAAPYSVDIAGASSLPFGIAAVPGTSEYALTVACYCAGTRILTDAGERPVETLAIGDRVVTVGGRAEAIRWVGRRSFAGRFLAGRRELLPIVFAPGALGGGLPRRELRVSPCHALLLDGVLVPARHLLNGSTIWQDSGCQQVDYIHIELDQHAAVWAEGAASETFLEAGTRFLFHNAADYPQAGPPGGDYCAPRVESGPALDAIRARLAAAWAA